VQICANVTNKASEDAIRAALERANAARPRLLSSHDASSVEGDLAAPCADLDTANIRIAELAAALAVSHHDIAQRDATIAALQRDLAAASAGLHDKSRELEAAAVAATASPRGGAGATVDAADHKTFYAQGPMLGRGTFGIVRRATTTPAAAAASIKVGLPVAVKVISAPFTDDEERKLQREMTTLDKVRRVGHVIV